MIATAKLRHLRIAPRKVRLVVDLVRGKPVKESQAILNFVSKKSALPLLKLLKSAISNAKNRFQADENNLYISKITVDEGPKLKRWMPRARGQVSEIQKKTSHITIILDEIAKMPKKITRKAKKEKKLIEEEKKIKIIPKEKPRKKIRPEIALPKPKTEKGLRRIFKRKSF